MSKFLNVEEKYGDLRYMGPDLARKLRELIIGEGARDILEIGFYQGKSSAYIAAVLEDIGEGSLTTFDKVQAKKLSPNIENVLDNLGLTHRVTPFYCTRSYTWGLQRLINTPERPQFDLCFFDGGHTWDSTGFGVLLVDMLLRPGGLLVMAEMDWTMAKSPHFKSHPQMMDRYDEDEVQARPVRLVWDLILNHLNYEKIEDSTQLGCAWARKAG